MVNIWASDRAILQVQGKDAYKFLQNMITNDMKLAEDNLLYAAILTPQGKYLFDFFVLKYDDVFLIDIDVDRRDALLARLNMYKLRADVIVSLPNLYVNLGFEKNSNKSFRDLRNSDLGWREYAEDKGGVLEIDWDKIYVKQCIPRTGIELIADETYILESGFERINGVSFTKGCYVGQEVTARMKHKTKLRKGLILVDLSDPVPVGTKIIREGKVIGTIFSQSEKNAIAYLRFDRVGEGMQANDSRVILSD